MKQNWQWKRGFRFRPGIKCFSTCVLSDHLRLDLTSLLCRLIETYITEKNRENIHTEKETSSFTRGQLWQLWLRGRANVLLSEGLWLDYPSLQVEVSLDKILDPKLLPMCWSALCLAATAISVWTKKHLLNALNVNVHLPNECTQSVRESGILPTSCKNGQVDHNNN